MIPAQGQPPTPTPSGEDGAVGVLGGTPVTALIAGMVVLFLVVGLLVIRGRGKLGPKQPTTSDQPDGVTNFVRSWLGLGLVGGLLLMCAVSLAVDDATLRSTLFGGLIANVGAATAFYFASANSDQARKDILTASLPAVLVPDLMGRSAGEAEAIVAKLPLRLEPSTITAATPGAVTAQTPTAGRTARPGDTITLEFAAPGGSVQ